MIRALAFLFAFTASPLLADEGLMPAISIASPDTATTFVFGTIKNRSLLWNEATKTLSAEVTFIDEQQSNVEREEDTHRFRIPGVLFDKEHATFYAVTPAGERIPVARRKKTLFFPTIEVLPNAIVRISHPHGVVNVRLEAIRPADLARAKAEESGGTNSMGQHTVNLESLLR